jgi:hypothetical protein
MARDPDDRLRDEDVLVGHNHTSISQVMTASVQRLPDKHTCNSQVIVGVPPVKVVDSTLKV